MKAATLSLAVKENTQSVLEKEPLVSLPVFFFNVMNCLRSERSLENQPAD